MSLKSLIEKMDSIITEGTKETPTGRIHKAEPGGYGRKDDEDDEGKKVQPTVKRGRGRPKKDADSSTGQVAKYDNAKNLQSFMVGNLPGGKAPGKKGQVHKIKDESVMEGASKQELENSAYTMTLAHFVDVYGEENAHIWHEVNGKQDVAEGDIEDAEKAHQKINTPAALRKAKGGDWKVSSKDLEKEKARTGTSPEGLAALKSKTGLGEATKETPTGKIHKAEPGGYGRKDDEDDEGKKVQAQVKRGRGRPKKGADSDTGEVKKWDTDKLSSWIIGNKPKSLPGKASVKHKLKDWMEYVEKKTILESVAVEGRMKDIMWADAEKLSKEDFLDKYPEFEDFWMSINVDPEDEQELDEMSLDPSQVAVPQIKAAGAPMAQQAQQAQQSQQQQQQQPGKPLQQTSAGQTNQPQMGAAIIDFKQANDPLQKAMQQAIKNKQVTVMATESRDFNTESMAQKLDRLLQNYPYERKLADEGWGIHESLYQALCDHYWDHGFIPREVMYGPSGKLREFVEGCYSRDVLGEQGVEEGVLGTVGGGLAGMALGGPVGAAIGATAGQELTKGGSPLVELDVDEGLAGAAVGRIAGSAVAPEIAPISGAIGGALGSKLQDTMFANEADENFLERDLDHTALEMEMENAMNESKLNEKAKSKAQQKFMGMVHAAQKGEKPASKEVADVAKGMKKKDAKDFASTKHKGLPEKVKKKTDESVEQDVAEASFKQKYKKYLESKGINVTDEILEEGWKQKLGAIGTAAAMGLGAMGGAAHASPGMSDVNNPVLQAQQLQMPQLQQKAVEFAKINPEFKQQWEKLQQTYLNDLSKLPKADSIKNVYDLRKVELSKAGIESGFKIDLTTLLQKYNVMKESEGATGDSAGSKARAKTQMIKMYGDGEITFSKTSNGGYFIQHEDDFGDTHSHQYDPQTGKVDFSGVTRSSYYGESVAEEKDVQMESWENQLSTLLNEGMTITTSTGNEGASDSVSISATDADAQTLMKMLQNSGLMRGQSSSMSTEPQGDDHASVTVEPVSADEVMGTLEPADDNGDDAMGFLKRMLGARGEHSHAGQDDSGHGDFEQEDSDEECEECGHADCQCDHEEVDEMDNYEETQHSSSDHSMSPVPEEEEMEEGNKFTGNLAKARASGKKEADLDGDGDMEKVKEDDVEEGNKFTGNLAKARAAGKKEADLDGDGDMEKVKEDEWQGTAETDMATAVSQKANGEEDAETEKETAMSEGEDTCNECGMYESKCGCDHGEEEKLDEWANSPNDSDEKFLTDLTYMTKTLSGGLNNMKRDQTVLPSARVKTEVETRSGDLSLAELIRKLQNIN